MHEATRGFKSVVCLRGLLILLRYFGSVSWLWHLASRMGWKLTRLLPGLFLYRIILSNIVALFRVFTHVVVVAMASPLLGATFHRDIYSLFGKTCSVLCCKTTLEVIPQVLRKKLSLQQKRKRVGTFHWPPVHGLPLMDYRNGLP